jgi:hypothetical protein
MLMRRKQPAPSDASIAMMTGWGHVAGMDLSPAYALTFDAGRAERLRAALIATTLGRQPLWERKVDGHA